VTIRVPVTLGVLCIRTPLNNNESRAVSLVFFTVHAFDERTDRHISVIAKTALHRRSAVESRPTWAFLRAEADTGRRYAFAYTSVSIRGKL